MLFRSPASSPDRTRSSAARSPTGASPPVRAAVSGPNSRIEDTTHRFAECLQLVALLLFVLVLLLLEQLLQLSVRQRTRMLPRLCIASQRSSATQSSSRGISLQVGEQAGHRQRLLSPVTASMSTHRQSAQQPSQLTMLSTTSLREPAQRMESPSWSRWSSCSNSTWIRCRPAQLSSRCSSPAAQSLLSAKYCSAAWRSRRQRL